MSTGPSPRQAWLSRVSDSFPDRFFRRELCHIIIAQQAAVGAE